MVAGKSSLDVYEYAQSNVDSTRGSSTSGKDLLQKGRNLIAAVESRDGWRAVRSPSDPRSNRASKNAPPTPLLFRHDHPKFRSDKPAKNRVVIAEPIDVSKLKEFEGTDFSYLFDRKGLPGDFPASGLKEKQVTQKGKTKRQRDDPDEADDQESRRKRPRSGGAAISLYELIPTPHHHPYSALSSHQSPNLDITKRFPPYSKSSLVPPARSTSSISESYFADPYARSAWIIPVGGKLPWEEASPAHLVVDHNSSGTREARVGTSALSPSISWTPFVINKFWSDLLEVRKQGVLGSISLSYYVAASMKKLQRNVTRTTPAADSIMKGKKASSLATAKSNSDRPKSLEQCTYIKVYHDARYAMYVRSVLDAWRTEVEVPPQVNSPLRLTRSASKSGTALAPSRKAKVRPLQGMKLVLLDETGQAIGVC